MLVHGSLCDYRYWEPQIRSLASSFHLVVPSLAHYYPVLPSASRLSFSWKSHVEQLQAFLSTTANGPVHLVGHSRGGCLAYQLALRSPHNVRSLTLIDPGGPLKESGRVSGVENRMVTLLRQQAVALIDSGNVDDGLRLFVDSVSQVGVWDKSPSRFKKMARDNATTLGPQFLDPLPCYAADTAQQISCPTLLVEGERSPKMYRNTIEALNAWLPNSKKTTIQGASHGLTASHASIFNTVAGEFWSSLQGN